MAEDGATHEKGSGEEREGHIGEGEGIHGNRCKNSCSARRRRLELRRMKKRVRDFDSSSAASSPSSSSSSSSSSGTLSPPSDFEMDAREKPATCVSHGSVSLTGRRREMEDAVTVAPAFASELDYDFFAVYDGHGGAQVAHECRERMHVVLAEEVAAAAAAVMNEGEDWWREALAASFARVDGELSAVAAADGTVGSTAVVALVGAHRIVVANCGDSRAVLYRAGVALPLSTDHKPDRPDEMERVEAAGGRVINWDGYRVVGVLSTSRSIAPNKETGAGDYYLKPYVVSEPEVTVTDRTDEDEFLILASDGLWDVMSNEVACKVARQCLTGRAAKMFPEAVHGCSAAEAAALLAELAMSRGSQDNITVVVVELKRLGSKG